jgi:predicted RNA binding protein YcfA (HicA-like mRNA interferase family)
MMSAQLNRWLERRGCTFQKTKSGPEGVPRHRQSVMPFHGKKEMKTGTVEAI